MGRQQIEADILSILGNILKCEIILNSSRENTPQWDSLKHIEIIFCLEEELAVEFSEEQLKQLNSVRQIVEIAKNYAA